MLGASLMWSKHKEAIATFSFPNSTGVIINLPTGVFFTNQTGGVSCNHPELEGIFIPLHDTAPEPCICFDYSEDEASDMIQDYFDRNHLPLRVDRTERLEEAWIPVVVTNRSDSHYYDFSGWRELVGKSGRYVYNNCD